MMMMLIMMMINEWINEWINEDTCRNCHEPIRPNDLIRRWRPRRRQPLNFGRRFGSWSWETPGEKEQKSQSNLNQTQSSPRVQDKWNENPTQEIQTHAMSPIKSDATSPPKNPLASNHIQDESIKWPNNNNSNNKKDNHNKSLLIIKYYNYKQKIKETYINT